VASIEELRWFAAVVEDPNVTRVAGELHVSQPALSRSLRRLEASLGVRLFDRVGRGVTPNRHGRAYAAHVRRALQELDAGAQAVGESAEEVRLAFLYTLGVRLVPELLRAYRATHPHVRFRLSQAGAGIMASQLEDGQHDLVITSPRPDSPAIAWRALFSEPLRLAVPPDHRLAHRRRIRLAEVKDDPFVINLPGYGLRGAAEELCAAAGFQPRIAFEGEEVETLRGLVAAGLGVALLPERPGAPNQLAVADRGARRTIGLAWHRERYRSPAVIEFAEFVAATPRPRPSSPGATAR
jgi:LysR family transcriptional regulator, transcription activator of glutamate synthase operon